MENEITVPTIEKTSANTFYFTDRALRSLELPATGQKDYWDLYRRPRGFGMRISATGVKSFTLTYRTKDPKSLKMRLHRMVVGRYPETSLSQARDRAEGLRGKVSNGKDPLAEKAAERIAAVDRESFAALAARKSGRGI